MNTNGSIFPPFLLSIIATLWPRLLSALLRLPQNIHHTMNHVQMAGRAALVSPALSRNRLSHCSLWSSAGSWDYTLSLHMPCWLRILDIFSGVPCLPRPSIFFDRMISLSLDKTCWEEIKTTCGKGSIWMCFCRRENALALMSCSRTACLLNKCQKSWWLRVMYSRKKQRSLFSCWHTFLVSCLLIRCI